MNEKNEINFQKNDASADIFFKQLEAAREGLIYISETDALLVPFTGTAAAGEPILQQLGAEAEAPLQEVSFDRFFARLTEIRDYYGEPEKATAQKFLELKSLLEENLRDMKVFRVGTVRVDIYVVGAGVGGRLIGVSTMAVET